MRQVFVGRVDPGDVGKAWCLGWSSKAVGLGGVGVVEDGLAVGSDRVVVAVVDCECVLAIQQTRTVYWETIGLQATFTDWPGSYDLPPAPLHFASWNLGSTSTPPTRLATPDGIRIGSTAADVRSLPNSSPMIPDVTQWGFTIADDTGAVSGQFAWVNLPYYFYFIDEQFAVELQQALNDHGATLAVDGVVGPATTRALIDFAAQRNIDGFSIEPAWDSIDLTPEVLEVFWLLELPPDDAPVTSMWAADLSTCG